MDEDPLLFKIAHISDLHFSKISFSIKKLLSKEFIGNLNLLLHRSRVYKNERPLSLIDAFRKEMVTHVFITGDFSTTSSKLEFQKAKEFIDLLKEEKIQVISIPGNHDSYTKRSYKEKLFYNFFEESGEPPLCGYTLKNDQVTACYLGDQFWVVSIDSTFPSAAHLSTGLFTKEQDIRLRDLLSSIDPTHKILVMNHFPLFHHERPRRVMHGADLLQKTLSSFPNVVLYLHGHTHKQSICDLRGNHLPIIADSGSVSHAKKGTWNLLEVYPSKCLMSVFSPNIEDEWSCQKHYFYNW